MWSKKWTIIGLAMATIILGMAILTACGSSAKGTGPVQPTSITPQIAADTVSIGMMDVQNNTNTRFVLATASGNMTFMAYMLEDQMYVRASECVPCRGTSFTLDNDVLVCNTCQTRFNAKTGAGISGGAACMTYPKAAVAYQIINDNMVMTSADMVTAFNNTMKPGMP